MSGRIFQSVIVQMKEATSRVIGVIDSEGGVVACNELSMVGTRISKVASVISESNTQTVVYDAKLLKFSEAGTLTLIMPSLLRARMSRQNASAFLLP